jgi:hypothetical protein
MINPKVLQEMRHLGLYQRAAVLKQHWQMESLSHMTVSNYYRRLGVTFKKPQIVYYNKKQKEREIGDLQQDYCKKIVKKMMHDPGLEIIYVDETSFNLWQSPSRVW